MVTLVTCDKYQSVFWDRAWKTDPLYNMNALIGELGEVANIIKKQDFADSGSKYLGQNVEVVDWSEKYLDELGDCIFYFFNLCNSLGITFEDAVKSQFDKLDRCDKKYHVGFKK